MIIPVSLNNQSIESSGITNDYKEAICEYIWNGFEANATVVNIEYTLNSLSGIEMIAIEDNGTGIIFEELQDTFGTFLTSKKNLLSLKMKSKANKGKGRFSFVSFADNATWETTYTNHDGYSKFLINMSNDKKEVVNYTNPEPVEVKRTGTTVIFTNIRELVDTDMDFEALEPILLQEFAWFLYLYKNKNISLKVRGKEVDYKKYINTELSEMRHFTVDGHSFETNLVVWKQPIKEKYCCYYFDEKSVIKGKDTTTFNRNTVGFNHSVFVKSAFFNQKNHIFDKQEDEDQISLFESIDERKVLKQLQKCIQEFIEEKLGVYIADKAEALVEEMINERETFPRFSDDAYGQIRKNDLKRVTTEIIKLEPSIFHKLKPIQEKSILAFLNLLLDSQERENIIQIIDQIIELSPQQRHDFADILKKTKLENVIETIKFVENRYKVIELLKTIVYDLTKFSNERDHLQKIIETHFWLFGEQYTLATADQNMKRALEKYSNILYGENDIDVALEPDVENDRRMDIFLCNSREKETDFGISMEENIVVELKAPKVPLSKKVLRQIEDYMDYVRRQPLFNSSHRKWKFIAVCKEVDDDIKSRYETFKDKGKIGLVSQVDSYEVYAYTWDDVFRSFEIRHAPLLRRLKYDKDELANELLIEVSGVQDREKVDKLTEIAVNNFSDIG